MSYTAMVVVVITTLAIAAVLPRAIAQSTDVVLTWDYDIAQETNIDRFVLQKKVGSGLYNDVPIAIAKTSRMVTDSQGNVGSVSCYIIFAEKGTPGSGAVRSKPSNETCGILIAPVTNLRIK